ncbi:homocysteine S-methyltransferase family protein [Mobilitalea sibirica]|uniref:Methionine synthase n=1 Tax=Mobilitalea sibirica TaxID=1462919 RepID=A0A8J7H1X4_9FIRM|nr:homocysteine S-methyltransferase family protein [Mobilitalea sibirica]MBH1940577.1 homocysteine S-methyltransferase family protein [Mobilitalea sibirica]
MTKQEFLSLTQSKIVILDGATGSNLQKRGMAAGVCPECWMVDNKEKVVELQREFLEAGTDILFAPTFTANRIKLEEYGQTDRIVEFNRELIKISKEAIRLYREKSGDQRNIYIAADMTMTGEQVYPVGKLAFEDLVEVYKEQAKYLLLEGVDLFVVETMMSLQECRAALLAIKELCDLPVMVSMTYTETGRTFFGTDPKTAMITLQSLGADAVGVNCSTGPEKMHTIIKDMKKYAYVPVMAKPNAGIPKLVDGHTVFPMEAEEFALEMEGLVKEGASIIGGCCGSTPKHIKRMADRVKNFIPQPLNEKHIRALTTERTTTTIDLSGRFMIIGERINPTGKTKLQEQLRQGDVSLVSKMAVEQSELGADILDLNLGMNGIDEKEMMLLSMHEVLRVTDIPLCIDSSHIDVIEAALRLYPGRALINSISLEKEKFEKLLPIAKKYGAMFILLPLSDQGLPKDMEEKKLIIQTILNQALKLGLTKEDIIVDGLVNTVGANKTAALEALETIRYCKEELGIATVVGLSNISFGLPERQFINSTFLAFAIQAGLTMAIANPSQDLLMNTAFAADLLLGKEDAAERYIQRVTARPMQLTVGDEKQKTGNIKQKALKQDSDLAKDKTGNEVFHAVIKGNKRDIISLVEQELNNNKAPEAIIEEMLIPAINEVGSLFDRQIYFLPQLIAGAETMKKAIDYLEPMLQKGEQTKSPGTVIIATVAGDIHDIGKNLVALMLKNYGYQIIDLGKDVAAETIISTAKEKEADIIALSALMTTTMVEMKRVVSLVRESGLKSKVIIGGAVITESYALEIGADGYSSDAQSAVNLVKKLLDPSNHNE